MKCLTHILKWFAEIFIVVTIIELMGYFLWGEKTSMNDILRWSFVLAVIGVIIEGVFRLIIKK